MIKLYLTALTALLFLSRPVLAQQDEFNRQMKVYAQALKYYDLQAATSALYQAMVIKPDRKDLRDSLALLYFAGERYGQSSLLGEEILKDYPERKDMLELVAVSKQSLGLAKEALIDYENLYKQERQPLYLYQIATLQYQLKRFGECIISLDQLLSDEAAKKQTVNIRNTNGTSQIAPIRAAAYNVKGIIAMEMNQEANAKDMFNKALSEFPDFTLAKGNLQMIEQRNAKATGTASAPPAKSLPSAAPKK